MCTDVSNFDLGNPDVNHTTSENSTKTESKGHGHWLIENKTTLYWSSDGQCPLEESCECGIQNFTVCSKCSQMRHLSAENKTVVVKPLAKSTRISDAISKKNGYTNGGFIGDNGKDATVIPTSLTPCSQRFDKDAPSADSSTDQPVQNEEKSPEDSCTLSLELFYSKKRERQERKPSTGSRKYYENQDKLIKSYEETIKPAADKLQLYRFLQKKTNLYAKLSFAANVVLLIAKTTAAVMSGSIAIITSLVDSVVDLCSGIVVWITTRSIRKTDFHKYPQGRKRMEPLAIVVLSVIMGLASLQLIKEAIQKIVGLINGSQTPPTVDFITIGIASATIVIKLFLYILCRGVASPTIKALAQDHRNDVISNTLAIACGYIGSQEMLHQTHLPCLIFVDPGGAIMISLYIVMTWYITGKDQSKNLTGKTAEPMFLSKITWLCMNYHKQILFVESVKAYHSGYEYTVEVDLGLPAEMTIQESLKITNSLEEKLESVSNVDRAFIHVRHK